MISTDIRHIIAVALMLIAPVSLVAQSSLRTYRDITSDSIIKMIELDTLSNYDGNDMAEIPVLVSAVTSPSSYLPTSSSVNTNLEVGEIPHTLEVLPSGSVAINIPIETGENPNGYSPQLSFNYDSSCGDGLLGWGWQINGLSSIVQTSKSIYYDGKADGVHGNTLDAAYSLDGNRLILLSQTATSATYQTETGHIKVKASISNGRISFVAKYPDGTINTYKTEDDIHYYVSTSQDRFGHTINYTYTNVNGHLRPIKITFGNNGENRIRFDYTTRNSHNSVRYTDGEKETCAELLSVVSTFVNDNAYRRYFPSYEVKGNAYVMTKLIGRSATKNLNPLVMYYGTKGVADSYSDTTSQLNRFYNFEESSSLRLEKGKFVYGSEKVGLIMLPNRIPYYEAHQDANIIKHSERYFYDQYKDSTQIIICQEVENDKVRADYTMHTGPGFRDIFCIDVDGNRGDEIVKVRNVVENSLDKVYFEVYNIHPISGLVHKYTRTYSFNTVLSHHDKKSINPKFYFTGDFFGDGRTEILAVTAENPLGKGLHTYCYLFDLDKDSIVYLGNPLTNNVTFATSGSKVVSPYDSYYESDKLFVMDYDGDGKSELCLINDAGINLYQFMTDSNGLSLSLCGTDGALTNVDLKDRDIFTGTFNDDSNTDFIVSPKLNNGRMWTIWYSKGNGQFFNEAIEIWKKTDKNTFYVQDVDHDGQSDLLCTDSISSENTWKLLTFMLSNGKNERSFSTTISPNTCISHVSLSNMNFFDSVIALTNTGRIHKYFYDYEQDCERLLTGFISSFGLIHQFTYQRCNRAGTYRSISNYPYLDYNGGMPICTREKIYHNNQLHSDKEYVFRAPVVHLQGRGFLGFNIFNWQDMVSGEYLLQEFNPFNFSVLERTESNIEEVEYDYVTQVSPNKILTINLSKSDIYDKATETSVQASYLFDAYDNLCLKNTSYGNDGSVTEQYVYLNIDNDTRYLTGLPTSITKTRRRGNRSFTESQQFTYDSNYQVSKLVNFSNSFAEKTQNFSYDESFRPISISTKTYNSQNVLTETFSYSDKGLLSSHTNELGQTETYDYTEYNQLSSQTNHKGSVTSYTYDNLGRLSLISSDDGSIEETIRAWSGTSNNSIWYEQKSKTGDKAITNYYDAIGRVVRSSELHYDGQVYTDKTYDVKGNVSTESYPYKTTASEWITYEYDQYNRPISITRANGNEESIQYDGLSVTTQKNGLTKTIAKNTMGDVISVTEEQGSISFEYDGRGEPVSIITSDNETLIEYDVFGRKTSTTDFCAGTFSTEYDNEGNIFRTTDEKGNTKTCVYDPFGRITKETYSDGVVITYTYNADGQVASIINSSGTQKTYSYDSYKRLSDESQKTNKPEGGQAALYKHYTYSDGKVSSIKFSSDHGPLFTENYIYEGENLIEVKVDNSLSVWKIENEDDQGRVSELSSAGFVHLKRQYDLEGRMVSTGSYFHTTPIQFFQYTYDDDTDCLLSREDVLRDLEESFSYDNANRLTEFGDEYVDYDNAGNITFSSNSGLYQYASENRYAVTNITTSNLSLLPGRTLQYNAQRRISQITSTPMMLQTGKTIKTSFLYDETGQRARMIQESATDTSAIFYFDDRYEQAEGNDYFYVGGDAYNANMVLIKPKSSLIWTVYFIFRDNLGSITNIMDAGGNVVQELSYDAWGNLRNPETHEVYAYDAQPKMFLRRGYTGHEHIEKVGLINMNARLYDPIIHRFIQPDPYIQSPYDFQNHNRYSYCLNNPLLYTDRSGEFFWLLPNIAKDIIHNVFRTFKHGINAWTKSDGWKHTYKSWKITMGLFKGNFTQVISRLTWELPQTFIGTQIAQILNMAYMVQDVSYYGGATVVRGTALSPFSGAFTLGSYIIGSNQLHADPNNALFQHEYGHYLQSQKFGPLYLSKIAAPSLINDISSKSHSQNAIEQDANIRAYLYFSAKLGGNFKWNPDANPITIARFNYNNQVTNIDNLHYILNWKHMFNPFKYHW